MRIAELSKRSGIGVSTIKFYLREKLLPAGERTQTNQALYGDRHLVRLQLIRALSEVGRLTLAEIGQILAVLDRQETPVAALTQLRGITTPESKIPVQRDRAEAALNALVRRSGKNIDLSSPAFAAAVEALSDLAIIDGGEPTEEQLDAYFEAVGRVVDTDEAFGLQRVSDEMGDIATENAHFRILIGSMRRDQLLSALAVLEAQGRQQDAAS
ncbi:MerR family transcriptional regulator [Corynebacterium breve]|uniref:MerR family transcriptional regulator n=1 Tax=Corynebacterium breve TaxID=3049799 RepID=A0ABY8VFN1_9CORY|nr:MerR family transcriptional regulator [Corynebacterium breve]WIM67912.1 MerR family transcriptional regulator [Corynebacterium breve]